MGNSNSASVRSLFGHLLPPFHVHKEKKADLEKASESSTSTSECNNNNLNNNEHEKSHEAEKEKDQVPVFATEKTNVSELHQDGGDEGKGKDGLRVDVNLDDNAMQELERRGVEVEQVVRLSSPKNVVQHPRKTQSDSVSDSSSRSSSRRARQKQQPRQQQVNLRFDEDDNEAPRIAYRRHFRFRNMGLRLQKGSSIDIHLPRMYTVNWGARGEIGRGHFAVVYAGKCNKTNRAVAVKRIKRQTVRPETLKTEIRALYKVRGHPNIVEIYDVFFNGKYVVLVMEMLGGGELFDRIVNSGAYSERDAARHFQKIASALKFMHARGVVHRDLKPENLVLVDNTPNSEIKISDFGLSKILGQDQDVMKTMCGTKGYSAPEIDFAQSRRKRSYTNKVDTWSLGVILYVILAAYHPFDPYGENNEVKLWKRITNAKYDFNDVVWLKISREAKDLITKLLCLDPRKRLSAEQILKHDWIRKHSKMPVTPLKLASRSEFKSLGSYSSFIKQIKGNEEVQIQRALEKS